LDFQHPYYSISGAYINSGGPMFDWTHYVTPIVTGVGTSAALWLVREARVRARSIATKDFVRSTVEETIDKANEEQLQKINGTYIRRTEAQQHFVLRDELPCVPTPGGCFFEARVEYPDPPAPFPRHPNLR
jgi:hypothetical protein